MKRREFISSGIKAGLALAASSAFPNISVGKNRSALAVMYTNDWHSRIDPFPMDGGKYQGLGGASKRSALINSIRKEYKNNLLLDAGDMWQGTPFFNFFHGELEFKLMSEMQYDAVTLGNHDFDAGLDGLQKQLPHATFEILTANYDFGRTILKDRFKPYKIFTKGKTRVGVFGIGIQLDGLVPPKLCEGVIYQDPIIRANEVANKLRKEEQCDVIICLSHLGYTYKSEKVSDIVLGKSTNEIDLIIGGHTHTFLEEPVSVINNQNRVIHITQTGWAGINLGKIDFEQHSSSDLQTTSSAMLKIS
ncbi:MAG: bifunctional metallophosphatase/5'-nucleotidase [Bacteroidetes bacterium]|nr:bifunctional metallophosphatase/5'-nucleotidase [Bacteroidota bacterium]